MTALMSQRKVLVLNKGYVPISIMPLDKAMGLIFGEYKHDKNGRKLVTPEPKAHILDVSDYATYTWSDWSKLKAGDGEAVIHGVHQKFKVPEIIILSRYSKFPQQKTNFSRRTIYKRDENTCQYCGCKPGVIDLSIDHIVPKSKGGLTNWTNCVIACTSCNRRKADKDLSKCGMRLIRQPKKPKFSFYKGEYKCDSWEAVLGSLYWNLELENDMDEE